MSKNLKIDNIFQIGINRIHLDEVEFWIRAGDTRLEFTSHYDLGDPFPRLVSLVEKVKQGDGASVEWHDVSRITRFEISVSNTDDADRVQLCAEVDTSDVERKNGIFRVECEREFSVSVLGDFLNELADHPDFVHQYLLDWDYLADNKVGIAVDKLWDEMVERDEVEDEHESEMAFFCQYTREHISIPDVEQDRIGRYLGLLRSAMPLRERRCRS